MTKGDQGGLRFLAGLRTPKSAQIHVNYREIKELKVAQALGHTRNPTILIQPEATKGTQVPPRFSDTRQVPEPL